MEIKDLKKIKPLFTKIVTTADKYLEDNKVGAIVDSSKLAGTIKPYQTVIAIGSNSAGIKEGDIVMINPSRFAVKKYKEGSLKDGIIKENPIIEFRFPIITMEDGDRLLLDTSDIDFIIEDYTVEEKTATEKAAEAGIYIPNSELIS